MSFRGTQEKSRPYKQLTKQVHGPKRCRLSAQTNTQLENRLLVWRGSTSVNRLCHLKACIEWLPYPQNHRTLWLFHVAVSLTLAAESPATHAKKTNGHSWKRQCRLWATGRACAHRKPSIPTQLTTGRTVKQSWRFQRSQRQSPTCAHEIVSDINPLGLLHVVGGLVLGQQPAGGSACWKERETAGRPAHTPSACTNSSMLGGGQGSCHIGCIHAIAHLFPASECALAVVAMGRSPAHQVLQQRPPLPCYWPDSTPRAMWGSRMGACLCCLPPVCAGAASCTCMHTASAAPAATPRSEASGGTATADGKEGAGPPCAVKGLSMRLRAPPSGTERGAPLGVRGGCWLPPWPQKLVSTRKLPPSLALPPDCPGAELVGKPAALPPGYRLPAVGDPAANDCAELPKVVQLSTVRVATPSTVQRPLPSLGSEGDVARVGCKLVPTASASAATWCVCCF